MRILYFNYLYDIRKSSAGAAVHVESLAAGLRQLGHHVTVCYSNRYIDYGESGKETLRNKLKQKLSRYLNQLNAIRSNGYYIKKEFGIIMREKPDVIVTRYNLFNLSSALIALWKKIPYVLEVNAPMAYESKRFSAEVFSLPVLPEIAEKLQLKLADRIFVVSNVLRDYFLKWQIPAAKVGVVHNGVDVDRFQSGSTSSGISFNRRGPVIGFVGSFHYWHGIEELAGIMRRLLKSHDNVNFILVGDGPMAAQLKEQFSGRGFEDRVEFTGYVEHDRIPDYIADMDIVLALYPKLDFFYFSPLKLFEYMAAGKAVVASGLGQIMEVIKDGQNGFIFEPGNLDSCLDRIEKLIKDKKLRLTIGNAALETMKTGYTWIHAAEKVEALMAAAVGIRRTAVHG